MLDKDWSLRNDNECWGKLITTPGWNIFRVTIYGKNCTECIIQQVNIDWIQYLDNKKERQNNFFCILNGQQYFENNELFCGVEASFIACTMKWLEEEEEELEEEGKRKGRRRRRCSRKKGRSRRISQWKRRKFFFLSTYIIFSKEV